MGAEYLMASFNFALKFPDEETFSAGWVLQHVVAPVARKLSLPFAIKCGTRRGANARLRQVGDGVSSFDVGVLYRLCTMFPDVTFLATILSMGNQREPAATARKFANHRLYGCWWFCINPSLIHSLTAMRVEMLGSAFTSQHSDSRVLEHLVYKWAHSACHNNPTVSSPFLPVCYRPKSHRWRTHRPVPEDGAVWMASQTLRNPKERAAATRRQLRRVHVQEAFLSQVK
jgi:hypothetical protein